MDAHGHDPHAHAAPSAPAARDPEWSWWLGASVLFMAVLLVVFVLPATHAAGPTTPERPLAPHGGHGGHGGHGEHAAAGAHDAEPAHAPSARDSEKEREADLLAALAGFGLADDSVPAQTKEDIRFLIQTVAESGLTFVVNDVERNSVDMAAFMLKRWEGATAEIYSPEAFIRRLVGYKLVDVLSNRVKFPDGSDQAISEWLQLQLSNRPPAH